MDSKNGRVAERLSLDHLKSIIPESTDELKKAVEQEASASVVPKTDEKKERRSQKEYTFHFTWKDARGKTWDGDFTNKILSIGDRQLVGILRARLASGMPAASIDDFTAEINLIIAHMTFSLIEKPSWAEDLRQLENVALLQALYEEVMAHEATFFGHSFTIEEG